MTTKEDKILEILDKVWVQKQICLPAGMIMDGCTDEDMKPLNNGGFVYTYGDEHYCYAIAEAGVIYVTQMELSNYEDVIDIIDKKIFDFKVQRLNDPYWNSSHQTRWQYMLPVIEILKQEKFRSVLEIGAYKINYTNISHNMDLEADFIDPDNKHNTMYIQDAGEPWNLPDKMYDMILACQTFEHFNGKQQQAFQELKRVGRQAVITIPWKWLHAPVDNCHYNINEEHCIKWFGEDYMDFVVRDEIKTQRRLLHFKF